MTKEENTSLTATLQSYADVNAIPERKQLIKDIEARLSNGAVVSYAQNYEDIMLRRVFGTIKNGLYVDVGAFDPFLKSVTNMFYKMGWSGINIDLCEENIEKFKRLRPRDINFCVAVGRSAGREEFYIQPGTTRSTKTKKLGESYISRGADVKVETRDVMTLTEILTSHNIQKIDFLSIDVEGAEEDVLSGLDFKLFRPTIIVAEATYPETNINNSMGWESILRTSGYDEIYFDGLNRFYAENTNSDLKEKFSIPPNYFDNFVRYEQILLALAGE